MNETVIARWGAVGESAGPFGRTPGRRTMRRSSCCRAHSWPGFARQAPALGGRLLRAPLGDRTACRAPHPQHHRDQS